MILKLLIYLNSLYQLQPIALTLPEYYQMNTIVPGFQPIKKFLLSLPNMILKLLIYILSLYHLYIQ